MLETPRVRPSIDRMHGFLIALLIFSLRIMDVSVGTVRVIYTIRGKRLISGSLGVVEAAVWIFAISKCMIYISQGDPWAIVGWSIGFGTGTAVGITIERLVSGGSILMRIITHDRCAQLREALLSRDIGVTCLPAEGRDGEHKLLFVVVPRRRGKELLAAVRQIDPHAFITIDPVSEAIGGYIPIAAEATAVRK